MPSLSREDAFYAADKVISYFSEFNRIDDYFRHRKVDRVKSIPTSLFGGPEDDLFSDYSMNPEDMEFRICQKPSAYFNDHLEIIASFSPDEAPGKTSKLVIQEVNTGKDVGFIKYGSPLINSKPRNDWLGEVPDLPIWNKRVIMGFIIVPTQPFGFNYLGGKLMAAICCSHEAREILDKKYNTEFCLFETTSLYGNIKGASMYDGMRPYLKYRGDTMSSFLLTMGDDIYPELRKWFEERNNGPLVHKGASSRKLKTQTKMIGMIKSSLKEYDTSKYDKFCELLKTAMDVTTQKRFYMSDYGYDNVMDVLKGKTETLVKSDQYEKYSLENITKWWKKKAGKRFKSLKSDGRVRTKLEYWNADTINSIDIIR
jgi:hypothetical protein